MKIEVLLVGTKGLTYKAEVLLTEEVGGELFAAHAGHNKLMHTMTITHFETGKPVAMSKVHPETKIDEQIAPKYMEYFRNDMINFNPGDRKKINTLPEKSA